jgi:GNAT superfamily N-acetyltransferase
VSDLTSDGQNALALPDSDIVLRRLPDGQGRPGEVGVDLLLKGRPISTCGIIPFTLRIGAATVRMDGIGMVGTLPRYRARGYAHRVLTAALAHMAAGDAALSMLYGIPNFYLQFGYTAAGPEYTLAVPLTGPAPPLTAGWQARPALPADLPALQRLYEHDTAGAVGTVVRTPGRYPWTKLARLSPADLAGACRVVVDPQGTVAAYAWADRASWFTRQVAQAHPHSLALGAYAPADLLARLERPPAGATRALLEALFPLRHPHLSLPDRY